MDILALEEFLDRIDLADFVIHYKYGASNVFTCGSETITIVSEKGPNDFIGATQKHLIAKGHKLAKQAGAGEMILGIA